MRKPIDSKYVYASVPSIYPSEGLEYQLEKYAYTCPECYTELYGNIMHVSDMMVSTDVYSLLSAQGYSREEARDIYSERRKIESEATDKSMALSIELNDTKICPICGGRLSKEPGYFHRTSLAYYSSTYCAAGSDYDEIFSDMEMKRNENIKNNAKTSVQSFVKNCNSGFVDKKIEVSAELSLGALKSYVQNIFNLEASVYDLSTRLEILYETKEQSKIDAMHIKNEQIEDFYNKITELEAERMDVSEIDYSSIPLPTSDYDEEPLCPRKPIFEKTPPYEPTYKKPGFFNKKSVLAENEIKKQEYEKQLAKYTENKLLYEDSLRQYNIEFAEYEKSVEDYRKKCKLKEEVAKAEYERLKKEYLAEIERKNALTENKISSLKNAIMQLQSSSENLGEILIYREIEQVEKLLNGFLSTLKGLYQLDIVYPKYRNMIAIASFCDYLLSGRCKTLEGADGAYNLFESEIRNDIIITKLSDVVNSLVEIQDNQYMLYEKLCSIDSGIKDINSSMNEAISILRKTEMNTEQMTLLLDSIEKNTTQINVNSSIIAENSNVIAHYSEITAYYSKKNAELTDAMGYLVAFK